MKIEKLSDTQIRCTLSKQDLADRDLNLSELAYGSDKAKDLFRELMVQAAFECNFEAEDLPLMIEAIPISADSLVLLVTKVEDPDELDTRFSNFSPVTDTATETPSGNIASSVADEILSCFGQLGALLKSKSIGNADSSEEEKKTPDNTPAAIAKIFSFGTLDTVTSLSKLIAPYYFGASTLYKDETEARYYLVIRMSNHTPEEFNRICNVISEYGKPELSTSAAMSYCAEHFKTIVAKDAVQTLNVL